MGTTVGNVLISYDIDKFHTQVKTALEELGYYNKIFQRMANVSKHAVLGTNNWSKCYLVVNY